MKRSIEALTAAGLSEKEATVYMDLIHTGESRTGKLCERTGIPSSHIYKLLDSLVGKGLVNYKIVNNVKAYRASDPDALAHLFEEKEAGVRREKKELMEIVSKLKIVPPAVERMNDFKYFEGVRGIKSMYSEVINSWKKGDEYCVASAPAESFERLEGFFMDVVHKKRVKDRVKLKIIVNKGGEGWGERREKMPLTEVRYLNVDTETEYGVLNEYFFLVNYSKEPYGLLIKDRSFAETYGVFFGLLWKQAKARAPRRGHR